MTHMLRDPLAQHRLRVGAYWAGHLGLEKVFDAGATIWVGDDPAAEIFMPGCGFAPRLLIEHGTLLHVSDAMVIHVVVDLDGQDVILAGNLGEGTFGQQRQVHVGLTSPVRIVGERAALHWGWGSEDRYTVWLRFEPV